MPETVYIKIDTLRHFSTATILHYYTYRAEGYMQSTENSPLARIAAIFLIVFTILLIAPSAVHAQLSADDIAKLRERGQREGWTFTVDENPATAYPLTQLTGTIFPREWGAKMPADHSTPRADLPASFDWRTTGSGCPPVRNQGDCGSCWAFSTVGTVECNILMVDEDTVDLSEQWLVSCNPYDCGCDGGGQMFELFTNYGDLCGQIGAVMEEDFGYAAADLPCNCPHPRAYTLEGYYYIGDWWEDPDIEAMKQAIMDHGPISVGVYVDDAFQGYSHGVFNACVSADWVNHLVVLVGWDDTMGTNGVWIMRNSWGDSWGEDGYMYIEYGCSMIGDSPMYVVYRGRQRIELDETEFSDILGDNDGEYEPGETVELVCGIRNGGPAMVTDVSVDLVIDDTSIPINDGSTVLGNIASGDTVYNSSDPFSFDIPIDYIPRIDSFLIIVTWNHADGLDSVIVDTMVIEENIGGTKILIVDDDNGGNREKYYESCFINYRVPYHCTDLSQASVPDATALSNYDIVIWFTGDYRDIPLTSSKIAGMAGYLDNGGNLLLSGQGIAKQLADGSDLPTDLSPNDMEVIATTVPTLSHSNLLPQFLDSYLKSEYVTTLSIPILSAVEEAQVFAVPDSVAIAGYGGAGNQQQPDHIAPVGGGVGELQYYGQPGFGAVSYSGAYKSIFMSFGFEAIVAGDERWTDRNHIYEEIIDFFNYQMPDFPSTAAEEPTYQDSRDPEFVYDYEVYSDAGLTSLVTAASDQPEDPSGITTWTVPMPLTEDQEYFWRVRGDDGSADGPWTEPASFWINAVNQPPTPFALITPANNSTVSHIAQVLTWGAATDADLYDTITYCLYCADNAEFSPCDSATGLTATSYDLSSGDVTVPAFTCYWRVKACDLFGGETWSTETYTYTSMLEGDANSDGQINLGDAVFIVNYVFRGGTAPNPLSVADANCDSAINIGDAVYIINYIFKGGQEPGC